MELALGTAFIEQVARATINLRIDWYLLSLLLDRNAVAPRLDVLVAQVSKILQL